jgi:hypothetical protein
MGRISVRFKASCMSLRRTYMYTCNSGVAAWQICIALKTVWRRSYNNPETQRRIAMNGGGKHDGSLSLY